MMLKLQSAPLRLDKSTLASPNLTGKFSDDDLARIGEWVWEGYRRDAESRKKWEARTAAATDLAMQIQRAKSFPWPNASNIAFPLVTISTLQYHAKAYPAIIQGSDLVKYRVIGEDPEGQEEARALRIGSYMSWQLLEGDPDWEEQHDRLLINYSVVGTAFKKTYFDPTHHRVESDLVMAKNLVLNYWSKSVHCCPRKTEIIPMFRNQIHEGIVRGIYRDVSEEGWFLSPPAVEVDEARAQSDNRQGTTPPSEPDDLSAYTMLEQHVDLDLDQDGYAEPYIITIEKSSHCVVRLVTNVDNETQIDRTAAGKIITIRPTEYYTKYGFLPSPDGGIYDIGFGVLLGPLNESVNTAINQIFDAGTMQTAGGGFLGRGVKVRGGVVYMAPGQWQRVDSSGEDLKSSMVPYPAKEPSAVLYQLLVLLVNYSNRISGAVDVTVGEMPGQNTPAETSRNTLEMGMKIYNAIFKRTWRAMKEEFKKVYLLNAQFLPQETRIGKGQQVLREDYLGDPDRVVPVADPHITSDSQRLQRAVTIKQAAMTTPGYNLELVERNFLRALQVDGVEALYPGPEKVPAKQNPKVQIEELRLQSKKMELQADQMQFLAGLQEQRKLNLGKLVLMQAQAEALIAKIGVEKAEKEIAVFDAAIGAMRTHDEGLRRHIELMMKGMENADKAAVIGGRIPGMVAASGNPGAPGGAPGVGGGGAAAPGAGILHQGAG